MIFLTLFHLRPHLCLLVSHVPPMNSAEGGFEAVGCLGEMSKAQALASLLSCPLLEDLSEWSQWELIFKPLHGALKDFIERNAGRTSFYCSFVYYSYL